MAGSDEQSEEKTEKATEHKLKKSREKGDIATSRDAISLIGLIGVLLYLIFAMELVLEGMTQPIIMITETIGNPTMELFSEAAYAVAFATGLAIVPVFLLGIFGSITASILVNKGFVFSTEKLKPQFNKFNPVKNAKEKFKRRNLVEFAKVLIGILVTITIFALAFHALLYEIMKAVYCDLDCGLNVATLTLLVIMAALLIYLILAAFVDLRLQNALFMHDQRMTKTEVKREHKEQEGDPFVKSNRRNINQQILSQSASSALESTVAVLTDLRNDIAVGVWHPGGRDPLAKGVVTMASVGEAASTDFVVMARKRLIPVVNLPDLAGLLRGSLPMQPIVSDDINQALHKKLRSLGVLQ